MKKRQQHPSEDDAVGETCRERCNPSGIHKTRTSCTKRSGIREHSNFAAGDLARRGTRLVSSAACADPFAA